MRRLSLKARHALLDVCRQRVQPEPPTVIGEPYIPYVPPQWNGVLVLAEAQNLSATSQGYVDDLRSMSETDRMRRLDIDPDSGLGIQPWDDGHLPFALLAAYPEHETKTYAVSNAVPWSVRTAKSTNANPTPELRARAVEFWKAVLPILKPDTIVTAGKVAREVLDSAWEGPTLPLRLPSPIALNRVSGMFDADDLLRRFKEVRTAAKAAPKLLEGYRTNKIFYACHAVSLTKAQAKK